MCVLRLPQGQTIKEHLKRWQSSAPRRWRGGICRCMESMCMFGFFFPACAYASVRSRKVFVDLESESAYLHLIVKWMLVQKIFFLKIVHRFTQHFLTDNGQGERHLAFHDKQGEKREQREREGEREHEKEWKSETMKNSSERVFVGP